MSRLQRSFERASQEGRTALVAFLTAGFPTKGETTGLIRALVRGGADVVEIGVPFSDPLAEGPTIQRASQIALEQGTTLDDCLAIAAEVRSAGLEVPIVLMGYYNPIIAYGIQRFADAAATASVDGVIAVDVPPEESDELQSALRQRGVDLVFLLAPTSTEERIEQVARRASGFIYCVSVTGVTGARDALSQDLPEFLERVHRHTELPVAVGFGVSRREHVESIGKMTEGVVIGSAIIDLIEKTPKIEREAKVQAYVEVVTGRRTAPV